MIPRFICRVIKISVCPSQGRILLHQVRRRGGWRWRRLCILSVTTTLDWKYSVADWSSFRPIAAQATIAVVPVPPQYTIRHIETSKEVHGSSGTSPNLSPIGYGVRNVPLLHALPSLSLFPISNLTSPGPTPQNQLVVWGSAVIILPVGPGETQPPNAFCCFHSELMTNNIGLLFLNSAFHPHGVDKWVVSFISWRCNCSFSRGALWRTTGKCRCGVVGR